MEEAKNDDPVLFAEKQLLSKEIVTEEQLNEIKKGIADEINETIDFARNSPYPAPEEALQNVFAGGI